MSQAQTQAHTQGEAPKQTQPPAFADVVEAADALSEEDQAELIAILQRRRAARGRERLVRGCREADAEHAAGLTRAVTVDELMREIMS